MIIAETATVANVLRFENDSVRVTCPYCRSEVFTSTMYKTGAITWLTCVRTALLGYVLKILKMLFRFKFFLIRISFFIFKFHSYLNPYMLRQGTRCHNKEGQGGGGRYHTTVYYCFAIVVYWLFPHQVLVRLLPDTFLC